MQLQETFCSYTGYLEVGVHVHADIDLHKVILKTDKLLIFSSARAIDVFIFPIDLSINSSLKFGLLITLHL
jgi:hypothetical protein